MDLPSVEANPDYIDTSKDQQNSTQRISSERPQYRILYALGPGDVVGLYRDLREGKEPAYQPSMAFSKQFLDWCDENGAVAHAMSSHTRRDHILEGPHTIENRPKPSLCNSRGFKYHLGTLLYGLTIVRQAISERATIVIADTGTTHWIVFSLLSILRIPTIAVLHNTLWPMGIPPTGRVSRLLRSLDGFFFRHIAAATVCVSPECERQVRKIAGTPKGLVYQCRHQYREGFLSRVPSVPHPPFRPFQVLFLGRIEEAKGVFLILSIAEQLDKELPGQFAWKIVGYGTALEELEHQVKERKLDHLIEVPGRLSNEQKAIETFDWAHAMIVPTTSRFCEGLPLVATEAILAGRPVVLSSVVPGADVLGDATIEADADSVDSFVAAFRKLALDPDFYDARQRATRTAQAQFYDRSQGLGTVLGKAISTIA